MSLNCTYITPFKLSVSACSAHLDQIKTLVSSPFTTTHSEVCMKCGRNINEEDRIKPTVPRLTILDHHHHHLPMQENHQTEENPPRPSRKEETHQKVGAMRRKRYSVDDEDQCGEMIECSGTYCKSCTAGLIADCVALCCCPCALVNFFTLAFVKIPWMVGRKCFGGAKTRRTRRRKKKKRLEMKREKCGDEESFNGDIYDGNYVRRRGVEEGITWENVVIEEGDVHEKVWLEMYGVGHLGFGRVSFSGVQINQILN